MTKRILHFLFVIAACVSLNSCSQTKTVNTDAEKTKVKSVVDDFKNFWETKDMNLLSKIMSHDANMVNYGTDANEIFVGFEAFKDSITPMLSSVDGIKINVRNQTINVDADGNAAWFSEIWDWDISMGGQTMQQHNLRLTGVLEKDDGNWVIVQFHNSVPSMPQ
ncbi:MAG: nuclear transport factor 2 family protein [Ignavibacteriaceae bacterium]